MRLIQFETPQGSRKVGKIRGWDIEVIPHASSVRELALAAIRTGEPLERHVHALGIEGHEDYRIVLSEGRVLPPLDHADHAHCLVSGSGLTHLGSASTRDSMHRGAGRRETGPSDAMRLFKSGMAGGRPAEGQAGIATGWFYKGDGAIVVRPGAAIPVPDFADDAGEEPELAGLYVIGDDGAPYRIGFAIGNEFADHGTEGKNYLYLAHSKLGYCSFGPELYVGALPATLIGMSRIRREGRVIWEREFISGQDHMSHSIENLEYHHFKYNQFLRPGDVHVHFFGAPALSFADGVHIQSGDTFEISIPEFGEPLTNAVTSSRPRVAMNGVAVL
ncbi:AraD1 family protein [Noviherbaspirillum pedocola]|uniref:FAH family protein n=1 Tax=Noviherbaspirillum pedocola TaxID=2801341 RepID=A0A934T0V8_9BURK|nr:AraD1 family protein [Noviherbaspirillum pedocola]MBK4735353.1 FAH family protein [Noviherbaspirillum pedocola]